MPRNSRLTELQELSHFQMRDRGPATTSLPRSIRSRCLTFCLKCSLVVLAPPQVRDGLFWRPRKTVGTVNQSRTAGCRMRLTQHGGLQEMTANYDEAVTGPRELIHGE
jgi:hypothetical protein